MSTVTRRAVLQLAPSLAVVPMLGAGAKRNAEIPLLPQLDPELARAIVGESHRSFEKVKELVTDHPELAKAAIDWGFGDWESALGAAAHTGQRDIALLLIEKGARPDIFAFAMLGHTPAVRAMVEAAPGVQRLLGPHGLTLAHHARAGKERSRETLAYLESLGDTDTGHTDLPTSAEERASCIGDYQCADSRRFTVVEQRGSLQFKVDGWFPRRLFHQGNLEFHPAGAPSVRLRFEVKDGGAIGVTIRDGTLLAEAGRV